MNQLQITPVRSRLDRAQFIDLTRTLYANDPRHVQPLETELKLVMKGKTAYFEHAEMQAWLARKNGQIVGRISAQRDRLHPDAGIGQFGFLECVDDQSVFDALLKTACDWLQQRGAHTVQGPFDPSINAQTGLLVDGFDTPPSIMMGHARPYYRDLYAANGLQVCQNLLAYTLDPRRVTHKLMTRLARQYRSKVRIRQPDWRRRTQEMELMRHIFNDAWQDNWGFVPYTAAEFHELGQHLKLLVQPGWVQIIEYQDEPIAFSVTLPNINAMIHDLDGRLLPSGFIKLLWRLKRQPIRSARTPLMGVLRKYHGTPLAGAVAFLMIEQMQIYSVPQGLQQVELSWILKDNRGMRDIIEKISGHAYKHYQVFSKPIDPGMTITSNGLNPGSSNQL